MKCFFGTYVDGYCYMDDLLAIDRCRAELPKSIPRALTGRSTPLEWQVWASFLASHPDQRFANYIISGIKEGFRIGFDYQGHRCEKARNNMQSAHEHPQVIRDYIAQECAEGRILGPLSLQRSLTSRLAGLGLSQKKATTSGVSS